VKQLLWWYIVYGNCPRCIEGLPPGRTLPSITGLRKHLYCHTERIFKFFITLTVAFHMWLTNPQDMKVIHSWINSVSENTDVIYSSFLLHPELWTHILPFPDDLCGVHSGSWILSSTCSILLSVSMGGQQNNVRWL